MSRTNTTEQPSEPPSSAASLGAAHPGMEPNDHLITDKDPVRGTHPAAEFLPLLEGEEFDALVADITAHGLREPITLDPEGLVLDGRNRLRACRAAGVTPSFRRWDGQGSPLAYVVSKNLHRRHLDTSQRAMIAARIVTMRQGERTDLSEISERLSQPEAAKLVKVSPDSVGFARKVLRDGDPALVTAADAGDIPVSVAADLTSLPPNEQREVVSRGPRAATEAAKRSRSARSERSRRPARAEPAVELTRDEKGVVKEALLEWARARQDDVYPTDLDVLATKLGFSLRW